MKEDIKKKIKRQYSKAMRGWLPFDKTVPSHCTVCAAEHGEVKPGTDGIEKDCESCGADGEHIKSIVIILELIK